MARMLMGLGWVVMSALVAGTAQAQAPRLRVKKIFDRAHSTALFTINDAGLAAGIFDPPEVRLPATDDGTSVQVPPCSTTG